MSSRATVVRTVAFVRQTMQREGSGHDWWHVERVWKMARRIARTEKVDRGVVELAALLHDIADWKFRGGDSEAGPRSASRWLRSIAVDPVTIVHVAAIIRGMSFKGARVRAVPLSREGQVVQDADRLDSVGAIGIARAFAYGGHTNRELYNPNIRPRLHRTASAYLRDRSTSFNHFHEKQLLLRDRMNTKTARRIATARHRFLERYMDQFLAEWAGRA